MNVKNTILHHYPCMRPREEEEQEKYFPDIEHKVFARVFFFAVPKTRKTFLYTNSFIASPKCRARQQYKTDNDDDNRKFALFKSIFYVSFDQIANPGESRNSEPAL